MVRVNDTPFPSGGLSVLCLSTSERSLIRRSFRDVEDLFAPRRLHSVTGHPAFNPYGFTSSRPLHPVLSGKR